MTVKVLSILTTGDNREAAVIVTEPPAQKSRGPSKDNIVSTSDLTTTPVDANGPMHSSLTVHSYAYDT